MLARLTSDELAKDVAGAEALISRHKENKAEIDTRVKEITRFTQKGNTLIAEKNFLSSEVRNFCVLQFSTNISGQYIVAIKSVIQIQQFVCSGCKM